MEAAVLANQGTAVDAANIAIREQPGDDLVGVVVRRVVEGGDDHAAVGNEKVGIAGRQAMTVFRIVHRAGQGQFDPEVMKRDVGALYKRLKRMDR